MTAPEAWLRGPVDGVPAPLQPVAHALIQAGEDMARVLGGAGRHLWTRPGGAASIGYHARHAAGALDRLFTYGRGEALSEQQKTALREEGTDTSLSAAELDALFAAAVDRALTELRLYDPGSLQEPRRVGRAGLPSSPLGLLFHAAEHTTRHTGQAITTARILQGLERAT